MELKGLQVITDLGTGLVQVRFEAFNGTEERRNAVLTLDVFLPDGEASGLEPCTADLDLGPGGSASEEILTGVYFPKAWTPDAPVLYEVRVSLAGDGDDSSAALLTGFREFACDEAGAFRLNGRRVPVRPARVGPGEDPEVLIANAKREGYDLLRIPAEAADRPMLEACDRLGMMACVVLDARGGRDGLREVLTARRNHPSVVAWDLYAGEGPASHIDEALLAAVREADPTRMTILRRGDDPDRMPTFALQSNPYVARWQRNWDPEDPSGDQFDFESFFETFNP